LKWRELSAQASSYLNVFMTTCIFGKALIVWRDGSLATDKQLPINPLLPLFTNVQKNSLLQKSHPDEYGRFQEYFNVGGFCARFVPFVLGRTGYHS
jgi:hypothetical protein